MNKIEILDCTLRDGGYINNWIFGFDQIHYIIDKLIKAQINIIECGYISRKKEYNKDSSLFASFESIRCFLPKERKGTKFVAMINYGDFPEEEIPIRKEQDLDGIRIAFHKKDKDAALDLCKIVKEKGYELFIQPMVALNYTDEEFIQLIRRINEIQPAVFYIVDSFGAMRQDDVSHFLYLTDHNLDSKIKMGFHSHNNLQLSYSHAQSLCNRLIQRQMIIDSSIMGMGRGAGNLNTELFAEFLNKFYNRKYQIAPLLQVIDNVLATIYQKKYWGYSLPHYLSATHNCHPNYATYLDEKNTLTFENIHDIFSIMENESKAKFDKEYIQQLYEKYQSSRQVNEDIERLKHKINNHEILIIAPGCSITEEHDKIIKYLDKDRIVISLNFKPDNILTDYIFIGNIRRWEQMDKKNLPPIIMTSNIIGKQPGAFVVKYADLLNENEAVKDNTGLMLIKLLIQLNAKAIYIAGMDGYAVDGERNFTELRMEFMKSTTMMQEINTGASEVLKKFSKKIPISFITTPKYIRI